MFTKSQLITAAAVLASSYPVVAGSVYSDATEIEARARHGHGGLRAFAKFGGLAAGQYVNSQNQNDARDSIEARNIYGGLKALGRVGKWASGGYMASQNSARDIMEDLEARGRRRRQRKAQKLAMQTTQATDAQADPQAGSEKRDLFEELTKRAVLEYIQDLQARNPGDNEPPKYGAGNGWITPAKGKGRDGKVRQTSEVLAVQAHANHEPHHPAVQPGNTAHVQSGFHTHGSSVNHATVKYKDSNENHITTLHLAKDGTRLAGDQHPPAHRGGGSPPPNSPASHQGSPSHSRSSSTSSHKSQKRELVELIARELGVFDELE